MTSSCNSVRFDNAYCYIRLRTESGEFNKFLGYQSLSDIEKAYLNLERMRTTWFDNLSYLIYL